MQPFGNVGLDLAEQLGHPFGFHLGSQPDVVGLGFVYFHLLEEGFSEKTAPLTGSAMRTWASRIRNGVFSRRP